MQNKGRLKGPSKIRKQRWNRAPTTEEAHFDLKPTVASTCKWTRIARLQRKLGWEREYAEANRTRRNGGDPEYPPGTYWMRRFAGVRVAEGP